MKASRGALIAAAAGILAILAGAFLLIPGPQPPPSPSTGPSPSPPPPAGPRVRFELGRVRGLGPLDGVRPRQLRRPARAVARLVAGLYELGFVDPSAWAGGRFPGIERFFVGPAREEARRDLARLTLGRAVRHLSAVEPRRARLRVSFLVDRRGRPLSAVASARFAATGLAEDGTEVPVRHQGDYTLRKTPRGWRIVAYDVRARVPGDRQARRPRAGSWPALRGGPLFVLVIGTDARPGWSIERSRADSIHIVGVNPAQRRASIVGIPRDSLVQIPGAGLGRINAATTIGGPELLVRTVEALTGIRIDAWVLTGFDGFRRAVDSIGGIQLRIPYAMDDPFSRASFRPGVTRLSGREALAFSRDRHDPPGGAVGRSLNQGRLILAALRGFRADLRRDPRTLLRWALVAARFLRTDLSLREALDLLLAAPTIEPARVRVRVVSGTGTTIGGASVIRLGAEATATFRDLRDDAILDG
ncbi:MAG TPA: LCP family protein [Actinomycetota bacterium]|nr:LCP family protein [Actinomycetota bacterium]